MIQVHIVGAILALVVLFSIAATLYWMLHPPATRADLAAGVAEADVDAMIGSVIIVFSEEIRSDHMMALAVKVARREKARLLAAYVIEVPHTLPLWAEMEDEHRIALDALATAEAIARKNSVEIETDVVRTRQVGQGVIDLAKRKDAHLIILGSFREGKYSGAPLGRAIDLIAANAGCDVLIGVSRPRLHPQP